jgi:hypothetical protein
MSGPLTSKDNVIAQVVEQGGSEAYKRVIAFAKSKNIADNGEMWQWAEVFGFTAAMNEEMVGRMERALQSALAAHLKTVQASEAQLNRAADQAAAAAIKEVEKSRDQAQANVRKTGAEFFNEIKDKLPQTFEHGVFAKFEKPFIQKLAELEAERGRLARLIENAGAITEADRGNRWLTVVLCCLGSSVCAAVVATAVHFFLK